MFLKNFVFFVPFVVKCLQSPDIKHLTSVALYLLLLNLPINLVRTTQI